MYQHMGGNKLFWEGSMFTKKSISRVFSALLIVIFMLMGVLPVQAESLVSPRYASGALLWAKGMGGTGLDVGYRIAVDSNGNVYTTGFFSGTADFDPGAGISNLISAGSNDIFVSKLHSSGDFVWVKSMAGTGGDEGHDITVDSSGNVYNAGFFSGTVDFDPGTGTANLTSAGSSDIFISKLDNSGNFIWAKSMGGTGFDNVYCITLDSSGNVYTSGAFSGIVDFDPGAGVANLASAGSSDIFVSKLDSSGDFVWAKTMGGTSDDGGNGITVDSSGNLYTSGVFSGTADFDPGAGTSNLTSTGSVNIFVSKLNSNGNFVWAKSIGGTNDDYGFGIALDTSGNVYTSGAFSGIVDFDPDAGISNLASAGGGDIFVSKLNNNGDFVWAKNMGGTAQDSGHGITVNSSGNIYTTGFFQGIADFDPNIDILNLTSAGDGDIFISKLGLGSEIAQELVVTKTADTNDGVCNSDCSLREAIAVAITGDTITFDVALAGQTIYLTSTLLVDKGLTIDGSTLSSHIQISGDTNNDGTGDVSVFQTGGPSPIEFNGLDIVKGNPGGASGGGGIANYGTLTVKNSTVSGNSYTGGIGGGGIYNKGELTIIDSTVTSNLAEDGGGIFNEYGHTLTVTGSTFSNNGAESSSTLRGEGGAIANVGTLSVNNSEFLDNHAYAGGGAIVNSINGISTVLNSSFTNNSSFGNGNGGAINNYEGNMAIENCTFTGNSDLGYESDGGAVHNEDQMSIAGSIFTGNSSSHNGGGIATFGVLTVTNSTLSNNSAFLGGGIVNLGNLTITNTNISKNSATTGGGGMLNDDDGILAVVDSTISNNSAPNGGGIFNLSDTGTVNISSSTLSGNSVSDNGGGISNWGMLTATNITLFGNSAKFGGGIFNVLGTSTVTNSTISENSALTSGGGIFNDSILNYTNTIIANSTSGGDCLNDAQFGTINTNIHNLVEDGSCSASLSGDPNLGPLADNGGSTQTMALLPTSPAINAGDNDTCEATDQRGISRPQGAQCDIGAFEYIGDNPVVLSIIRKNTSPTPAVSVDFTVTFSESVTGLDMTGPDFDDFALTSTGVTGAAVSGVSGSGSVYTVTVNTGSGSGTIRLDIPATATITDLVGNPLSGLPFITGETYTINKNVDAYIGGNLVGSYPLAPGQSTRKNYAGIDSGPVKVISRTGTPIISAIRSAWAVNGVTTSFSQLMGLPLEQLSDTYVFPGYNNVTLNDQLRISNVDTVPTTVTVTIGGTLRGTYPLAAGAAVRINYPGLDSGPVVVKGTSGVKIISSIREAWGVNGVTTSFVQLMGLPAGQLSNKYVFPAYNNVTLNEQLRIGNVDTVATSVTVTIGGTLRGTYPLGPGQAVRINYPGLDSGPVVVEGTAGVNIISSIRSAWAVNGVTTSFSQLMGMPGRSTLGSISLPSLQQCNLERSTAHRECGYRSNHSDGHDRRDSARNVSAGGWRSRTHQLSGAGQRSGGGARHERGEDHLVHPRGLGGEWRDPEFCAVDGLARRAVVRYLFLPGLQ